MVSERSSATLGSPGPKIPQALKGRQSFQPQMNTDGHGFGNARPDAPRGSLRRRVPMFEGQVSRGNRTKSKL